MKYIGIMTNENMYFRMLRNMWEKDDLRFLHINDLENIPKNISGVVLECEYWKVSPQIMGIERENIMIELMNINSL